MTDYPPEVQAEDILKAFTKYGAVDTVEYKGKISFVNFLRDDEAIAVSNDKSCFITSNYLFSFFLF